MQAFAGKDGVIMSTKLPPGRFELSPDVYYESEVLIKGEVQGASVMFNNE